MRMLERNKTVFRFANLVESKELTKDELYTGEIERMFGPVLTTCGNISAATGYADPDYFGVGIAYDKVICMATDEGISETSVLWIDDLDADDYDYVVKRIARTINGVRIAVAKVR